MRCLLSGRKLSSKNIDIGVIGSADMIISDWTRDYLLKANHDNFFFETAGEPCSEYEKLFFEDFFWKSYDTERIFYGISDKTSISSLMRFSFFSDEDFDSKDSNQADLIHEEFDGKWKIVLFKYVLWQKLKEQKSRKDAFEKVNQLSQINKEIGKLKKILDLKEANQARQISESLFSDTGNQYKELQNNKLELENLIKAIQRLEILKLKANELHLGKDFSDFLSEEILFLRESKWGLESDINSKQQSIFAFSSVNPNDLLNYDEKKEKKKKLEEKRDLIEAELDTFFVVDEKSVVSKYLDIVDSIKWEWDKFYFKVDIEDLLVRLPVLSSEWILKWSKFLANVCFQLYSANNYSEKNKIPLLPIGIYDSVFWWADVDIIIQCFEAIKNLNDSLKNNLQIFVFMNRYNTLWIKNEIDLFLEENVEQVYNYEMPLEQKFLFK